MGSLDKEVTGSISLVICTFMCRHSYKYYIWGDDGEPRFIVSKNRSGSISLGFVMLLGKYKGKYVYVCWVWVYRE